MTTQAQSPHGASVATEPGLPRLAQGVEIPRASGGHLTLMEPVHSEARSRRWRASDPEGRHYDVLFIAASEDPGPLLAPEVDEGICGWEHERVMLGDHSALIFAEDHLRPLASAIPYPTEGEGPSDGSEELAARFGLAMALGELFEMLHVIGEALVVHGDMDAFALKLGAAPPEAVMRWPELLHPASSPPHGGSFKGYGLDAPEVTGEVIREIDQRADVFMLGVLVYALFSGKVPTPGLEKITARLPRLRAFNPAVPIGVDACVRRALSRLPEDRFETITAFLDALRAAFEGAERRALEGEDRRVWISCASHTDIGRMKREHHPINQDTHLSIFDPGCGWGLFAVMDGVSRADIGSGELASWVARNTLEAQWHTRANTPIYGRRFEGVTPYPINLLTAMAQRAHHEVLDWLKLLLVNEEGHPKRSTPCTTLAGVGIFGDRCALTSAGDSPIYLVRLDPSPRGSGAPGFIEQLTVDQNGGLENMRRGLGLTDALTVANAGWLNMAVGRVQWQLDPPTPTAAALDCDTSTFRLLPGDLLLITSDGIPDAFAPQSEREILRVLRETLGECPSDLIRGEAELSAAVRELIREADGRGGRDNMTAILLAVGPHTSTMAM